MELSISRVAHRAVCIETKQSCAVDRHVQRVAGHVDVALSKFRLNRSDGGPDADGGGSRCGDRIRVHVGKENLGLLESRRIRIGDVVADDVQITRRGVQTTQSLLKAHTCSLLVI